MQKLTFDQAFDRLIDHEGGYVFDPRDPGGETKYGISKRSYPALNIKNLDLETAKAIYRKDFWDPFLCSGFLTVVSCACVQVV